MKEFADLFHEGISAKAVRKGSFSNHILRCFFIFITRTNLFMVTPVAVTTIPSFGEPSYPS